MKIDFGKVKWNCYHYYQPKTYENTTMCCSGITGTKAKRPKTGGANGSSSVKRTTSEMKNELHPKTKQPQTGLTGKKSSLKG